MIAKHTPGPWTIEPETGAIEAHIPDDCACVFIAGTTEWKESYEAVTVIQRAQAAGKMVHIGRVNWWRRFQLFAALPGSDSFSFDGNRQIFDGKENTLSAWQDYRNRIAVRQLQLPTVYEVSR